MTTQTLDETTHNWVQPLAAQADFSSLEGISWCIPRDKRSLRRKDQDVEALKISCGAQVGGGLLVATRAYGGAGR
jgi:hypothetical protein